MIRSTVAHVDLDALQAQLPRDSASSSPAQSDRRRSTRASAGIIAVVKANAYGHGSPRVALALEQAGATMLACADIEEGIVLRQRRRARADPGVRRAERQRSRRPVRVLADADDLDARAARAVQAAAARHRDDGRLSPQDRHRHEPARLPPRQPAPHAAGAAGQPEPAARGRLHALRVGGRARRARCSTISASGSSAALSTTMAARSPVRSDAGHRRAVRGTHATAPRCCATRACWYDVVRPGLLLYGIVPPPLASTIPLGR